MEPGSVVSFASAPDGVQLRISGVSSEALDHQAVQDRAEAVGGSLTVSGDTVDLRVPGAEVGSGGVAARDRARG
jgi:hypothetical protein